MIKGGVVLPGLARLLFSRKKSIINEENGTKKGEAAGTCRICLGITKYFAEAILHAVYFIAVALLIPSGLEFSPGPFYCPGHIQEILSCTC